MIRRHRTFLLLLAGALLLAACSVSRLAYLNAPPLALFYLGGYVDMSDEQKVWVRDRLTRAMAWHREAQLPEYQRTIEEIIRKVEMKVSVEYARSTYEQARGYYHRAIEHLLPDLADFVLMLDESQVARIEGKFADDNKKLVKESLKGTPEDRRTRRAKKYVEQFEDWTGNLSPPQRQIIIERALALSDSADERLGDRRYRQTEFMRLIREKPPRAQVIAELRRLLIDTESWRRPEYRQRLNERDERIFEIVSELSATLTPEQRASVQRKMRGYVRDISSILAQR